MCADAAPTAQSPALPSCSRGWDELWKGGDAMMGTLSPARGLGQQLFNKAPTWLLQPCGVISVPPSPSTNPSALCSPSLTDFHFLSCLQITLFISKVVSEASFQLLSGCQGTGRGERRVFTAMGCFCPPPCRCSRDFSHCMQGWEPWDGAFCDSAALGFVMFP